MVSFDDIREKIESAIDDIDCHYASEYELTDGESANSERLENLIDEISEEIRDLLNEKIIVAYGRRV